MANFNMNKVILGGRLTADPELRQTTSGVAVTTVSIAVNRRPDKNGETVADFFNITAWRGTAETLAKFFRKGSSVALVGSIQNRSWTDAHGQKRYATDIVADEIFFVDSKNENAAPYQGADQTYAPYGYAPQTEQVTPHFEDLADDDDLPF